MGEDPGLGIGHRDSKPWNIMLGEPGEGGDVVTVLDFGLARTITDAALQITHRSLLGGTPAYIAPERVHEPATLDTRSDIYALGAVAYYLLTGEDAVSGATPQEVLLKTVHAEPVRPSRLRADVPEYLDELILGCLARDPDERPQSIAEVLDALSR